MNAHTKACMCQSGKGKVRGKAQQSKHMHCLYFKKLWEHLTKLTGVDLEK